MPPPASLPPPDAIGTSFIADTPSVPPPPMLEENEEELPEGWTKVASADGSTYYWNEETGASSRAERL